LATRTVVLFSAFFAFALPSVADQLLVHLVTQDLLWSRLERGKVKPKERTATIAALFREAGCEVTEQAVKKHDSNVICTLPGETVSTITVGAHLDFVARGDGIIDDWTGASMLASLFQALRQENRKHTFRFVAFGLEEEGLVGSRAYVKRLSDAERSSLKAYVNLECLGVGTTHVWASRSDSRLTLLLAKLADVLKLPLSGVNIDQVGDDDSHPFFSAHLPVLSLHSLDQDSLKLLHNHRDQLGAVHRDIYYDTYKLVAFYLALLDAQLD
jgi:Zn-dependent M28 family amino/carboxypeptidase